MTNADATQPGSHRELLENFHWEIIPMKNLEGQREHIPAGENVSVTCSPVKGIDETVRLSELLANGPVVLFFYPKAKTPL